MQETQVPSLGQEDPLQKEMAALASILAWRIPWTEEPDSYSPWGCEEPDTSECLTQKQNKKQKKTKKTDGIGNLASQPRNGKKSCIILVLF